MPLAVGVIALITLLGGLGYWSVSTKIAGAIVTSGVVVVERNRQVVHHLDGGIVRTIQVRDGSEVRKGDSLIELDDSLIRSELEIVTGQLIELSIRGSRLRAERFDLDEVHFNEMVTVAAARDPEIARQAESEAELFVARREAAQQKQESLKEQILQIAAQIEGADAQVTSLERRQTLVDAELVNRQSLRDRGLARASVILELETNLATMQGEMGRLVSERAALKGKIEELKIALSLAKTVRIEEAIAADRELQFSLIELQERRDILQARLDRMVIRAPVDGTVFDLRIFAEGSVIRPAEELLYLHPSGRPLQISARVEPIHIDDVSRGQEASLRLSALDQKQTPEISGVVIRVAPDALTDPNTGLSYYPIEIEPSAEELKGLTGPPLRPGMPVEVFIRTTDRTPFEYLIKPLSDYFVRAFRE